MAPESAQREAEIAEPAPPASPPEEERHQPLARIVSNLGVLVCAVVPYLAVAAFLHARLAASHPYSWARPLTILLNVARGEYFPASAAAALLLGEASRIRRGDVAAFRDSLRQHVDLSPLRGRVVAGGACALVLLLAGAVIGDYSLVDYVALAGLGAALGFRRRTKDTYLRVALELAFVLLLFTGVSYSFTVFKALLFHFREPRDEGIALFEHALFGVYPHRVVAAWAAEHPSVVVASDWIYYLLFNHMALVSIFLTGTRRPEQRRQFIAALTICYLVGGLSYYVYPGLGPGYFEPQAYAFLDHLPLAANGFRRLLYRNTVGLADGEPGPLQTYEYIACMPSLHMAHEFVMLYFARWSRPFFALSLAFTSFTLLAVVVLGWHYPIDAVFGAALAALAIAAARWQKDRLFPAKLALAPAEAGAANASVP